MRQGVDHIAIPCVTAHYFYPQLREGIRVPVIHGIRETARYLKEMGVDTAGILATDGTIVSGIFSRELTDLGIRSVIPTKRRQADVMALIYRDIKQGRQPDMETFREISQELRGRGAQVLILGCTELSLIKKTGDIGPGYLDAMEVLARESLVRCGKPLKKEYKTLIT